MVGRRTELDGRATGGRDVSADVCPYCEAVGSHDCPVELASRLAAPPAAPVFATDEQIDQAVAIYVTEMRARGVGISDTDIANVRRAARIMDVWRVAFDRVV